MKKMRIVALAATSFVILSAAGPADAAKTTVTMFLATANGPGAEIGTISFKDTPEGMQIRPRLLSLHEGTHGFHLYAHPTCAPEDKNGVSVPALAAGGPVKSGDGSPVELPNLYVHYDGASYDKEIAPNVKVADLYGHAVVVDALGPAYGTKAPAPVGGEIRRVACGVVDGK